MNRLLLSFFLCLVPVLAVAQQELFELARADIRSGRMGMIASSLELTPAQQEVFWPLYRKYADEQDALFNRRIGFLQGYTAAFEEMTADEALVIAEESFSIQRARIECRQRYFKLFSEALDPVIAARFIQIDSQVSTLLDFELMRNTPLIIPASSTPED